MREFHHCNKPVLQLHFRVGLFTGDITCGRPVLTSCYFQISLSSFPCYNYAASLTISSYPSMNPPGSMLLFVTCYILGDFGSILRPTLIVGSVACRDMTSIQSGGSGRHQTCSIYYKTASSAIPSPLPLSLLSDTALSLN